MNIKTIIYVTSLTTGRSFNETKRGFSTIVSRLKNQDIIEKINKFDNIKIIYDEVGQLDVISTLQNINLAIQIYGEETMKTQKLLQLLGGVRRKDIVRHAARNAAQIKFCLNNMFKRNSLILYDCVLFPSSV